MDPITYEFGEFRLEAGKRALLRDGEIVPLTPKVFDTLLHLVQRRGEVVKKEELMQTVWPNSHVEENNLNQNISVLRRVFNERQGEHRYILTVPGTGYQFVASVEVVGDGARSVAEQATTLAVLPFENLSADPARGYLADGLTEETIAALGQIDPANISVISRMSVVRYKQTVKSAAEVGRELGAAYLVQGSLRAEGGRLRITAALIRASDQVQVWTASYDSEPISMLVFQRELSGAIAEQIRLRLSPERLTALARRQTRNAEAYDLYLQGRHYWNQLSPLTTRRATEFYARATKVDPNYALAWSGLADAATASPITADAPPLEAWPHAKEAVAHALAAEPNLAEVQTSLGFLKFWLDWDWVATEAAHRKAIELDRTYPLAHRMLGMVLSHLGRHDEALKSLRRARELDPLVAANHALSAQVAFAARDYGAAMEFARHAVVVDARAWIGHLQLAQAHVELNNPEEALWALDEAGRTSGGNSKVQALRGYLLARVGRAEEARQVLEGLQTISRERYVPAYARALIYLGLRENERAWEWLERAYEEHDVHLLFLTVDPKWDGFRSERRFAELMRRCNFTAA
ncbi:MAG TPA: winged helix-turn-helix domain-containing protein [Candidatus Acidoferrum sp.]|jgi:DNA-binding winged helix-turn-helix (wHTH) protein/Flp pilus assembly protein TadD